MPKPNKISEILLPIEKRILRKKKVKQAAIKAYDLEMLSELLELDTKRATEVYNAIHIDQTVMPRIVNPVETNNWKTRLTSTPDGQGMQNLGVGLAAALNHSLTGLGLGHAISAKTLGLASIPFEKLDGLGKAVLGMGHFNDLFLKSAKTSAIDWANISKLNMPASQSWLTGVKTPLAGIEFSKSAISSLQTISTFGMPSMNLSGVGLATSALTGIGLAQHHSAALSLAVSGSLLSKSNYNSLGIAALSGHLSSSFKASALMDSSIGMSITNVSLVSKLAEESLGSFKWSELGKQIKIDAGVANVIKVEKP